MNLEFTKNADNYWEASCVSVGTPAAFEVNRSAPGYLIIYGSIDPLEKVILRDFGPGASQDMIVEIDVPADVKVTIISHTEVVGAKIVGV